VTTPSGAPFTAPKDWWLTEGNVIVLEDPDRKVWVSVVEVAETDPARAVARAWSLARPGFAGVVKQMRMPPPPRGWDAVAEIVYETRPSEHRALLAFARRFRGTHYVALVDGDAAALARRTAQLEAALGGLTPQGMADESFKGRTPRKLDAKAVATLKAFIEEARAALTVPGAAVAVVSGGAVVFEEGFGTRTLGRTEQVTPKTLFMIGSIGKSMTTMMEATLVDAGKFAWTTPVTDVLPSFSLGDPETTRKLTMAYSACACTGMPRQDLEMMFEFADVTPEQRLAGMKTMKPTTPFGEVFQYSNLLVAAGGYAAGHAFAPQQALGPAYDAAMKAKILDPIGMRSSTYDFGVVERAEHATPHSANVAHEVRPLPLALEHFAVPVRPAGGLWSNLADMERYVMTEMAGGVSPDGTRVVSEANLLERRKPRVKTNDRDSYGLGLGVGTYRGLPMLVHDGGTFGFSTLMFMLPEQRFAVVILSNVVDASAFNMIVNRRIVELAFDGQPRAAPGMAFVVKERHDSIARELATITRSPDDKWARRLVGDYSNAALGKAKVSLDASGTLTIDVGEWKSALGQKKEADGTLEAVFLDPPLAGTPLTVGGGDAKPTLTIEEPQHAYVFARDAP
jgi:CubicO group peptidase (beta-lactamase class C family)